MTIAPPSPFEPGFLDAAEAAFHSGQFEEAANALRGFLIRVAKAKDISTELMLLDRLALVEGILGNEMEAFRYLKAAAVLAAKSGDISQRSKVEVRRIHLTWKFGALAEVIQRINSYLATEMYAGERASRPDLGRMLGHAYTNLGQYHYARMAWALAIESAQSQDDTMSEAHSCLGLGLSYLEEVWTAQAQRSCLSPQDPIVLTPAEADMIERAEQLLARATTGAKDNASLLQVIEAENGRLYGLKGHHDAAEHAFQVFDGWSKQANDRWNHFLMRLQYAMYCLMTQRAAKAAAILAELGAVEGPGDLHALFAMDVARYAAKAFEQSGNYAAAIAFLNDYCARLDDWGKRNATPIPRPYFVVRDRKQGEKAQQASSAAHILDRAEQFIRQRLTDGFQVSDLAAFLSISTRRLQRIYQENLQMSPLQFITELRLRHARELLMELGTDDTVRAVGERSGFTRAATFIKAYAEKYGELPSQTRRRRATPAKVA